MDTKQIPIEELLRADIRALEKPSHDFIDKITQGCFHYRDIAHFIATEIIDAIKDAPVPK
jgi:hypothetical protein